MGTGRRLPSLEWPSHQGSNPSLFSRELLDSAWQRGLMGVGKRRPVLTFRTAPIGYRGCFVLAGAFAKEVLPPDFLLAKAARL